MGTWITCPNCVKNLPRKYQNKKEKKELHVATCKTCNNRTAQIAYATGIKRGIWLKKWAKAGDSFIKAARAFGDAGETESKLTSELMAFMSQLQADRNNKNRAKFVFEKIISGEYDQFLNSDFVIPEFGPFDPLYHEGKGWKTFFEIQDLSNILDKIDHMKKTAREFFNMGYGPLYFSKYFLNKKKTNVDVALNIIAEAEEYLGGYYASKDEVDKASIHLGNASSAYISLEELEKARKLKMIKKSLRMETACWVCGSRTKGHGYNFNFKFTGLEEQEYDKVFDQLKQRQERNPTIHDDTIYSTRNPLEPVEEKEIKENQGKRGIYLSTCVVCQGVINNMAKDIVRQELIPVWNAIQTLQNNIQSLISQLAALQGQVSSIPQAR